MLVAHVILAVAGAYLVIGALFAGWLLVGRRSGQYQAARLDLAMHGASWAVRLVLTPGAIVLWPVLLSRFRSARTPQAQESKQ